MKTAQCCGWNQGFCSHQKGKKVQQLKWKTKIAQNESMYKKEEQTKINRCFHLFELVILFELKENLIWWTSQQQSLLTAFSCLHKRYIQTLSEIYIYPLQNILEKCSAHSVAPGSTRLLPECSMFTRVRFDSVWAGAAHASLFSLDRVQHYYYFPLCSLFLIDTMLQT